MDGLGRLPDRTVATREGVSERSVRRRRAAEGVPPSRERRPWMAEEDALLGTDTDCNVAARLGRTFHEVNHRRVRLRIAAHKGQALAKKQAESGESSTSAGTVLSLTAEARALVEELAGMLLEEFRAKGLPLREVHLWQAVEFALREAVERRHRRTKAD